MPGLMGLTGLGLPGVPLLCPQGIGALGFSSCGKEESFPARGLGLDVGFWLLKL